MRHKGAIGHAERRYLRAIYELADGKAKISVSHAKVQEYLALCDHEADYCRDFWTRRGAVAGSTQGHIALTHLGLTRAQQLGTNGTSATHPEGMPDERGFEFADGDYRDDREVGSVSVVIPALNAAKTIGGLVRLLRRHPAVCEVLVVDDGSVDGTVEVASREGARALMSSFLGKGASMKNGVEAATREIVLFLDGDLLQIRDGFLPRMIDPILDGEADLVKAKFTRDAGRVTVLATRPLLGAFFPELAEIGQPLGGIVAIRRSLLENIRLENDYGVDVGLLIDAVTRGARVVEVDIGRIDHESQSLEALGQMAKQVTRVILDRAWRCERLSINQVRDIEEMERRAAAEVLPAADHSRGTQKFALFDMDGVLVDGRFVVELADRINAGSELSRFLDNESLSYIDRTRLIASLLVGVPQEVFEETAQSMPLIEGAIETVLALRRSGYRVGVVTDSFHVAAEIVRHRVFADFGVGNIMHFKKGVATGEVTLSPAMIDHDGCQLHDCCKSNIVRYLRETAGLRPEDTLAVGDGLNDICILREAGISIAFRPKSRLVEEAARYTLSRSLLEVVDFARDWSPGSQNRSRVANSEDAEGSPLFLRGPSSHLMSGELR